MARAGFDELVAGKGGRLVLLGDAAKDALEAGGLPADPAGLRWPVLLRPFTSQAVIILLVRFRMEGTPPCAAR